MKIGDSDGGHTNLAAFGFVLSNLGEYLRRSFEEPRSIQHRKQTHSRKEDRFLFLFLCL